jgi:hypothetical protein
VLKPNKDLGDALRRAKAAQGTNVYWVDENGCEWRVWHGYRETEVETRTVSDPAANVIDDVLKILSLGIVSYDRDHIEYRVKTIKATFAWNSCEPGVTYQLDEGYEEKWSDWRIVEGSGEGARIFGQSIDWWKEHSTIGNVSVTLIDIDIPDSPKPEDNKSSKDQDVSDDVGSQSAPDHDDQMDLTPLESMILEDIGDVSIEVLGAKSAEGDYVSRPNTDWSERYYMLKDALDLTLTKDQINTLFQQSDKTNIKSDVITDWNQLSDDYLYKIKGFKFQGLNSSQFDMPAGTRTVRATYGQFRLTLDILKRVE